MVNNIIILMCVLGLYEKCVVMSGWKGLWSVMGDFLIGMRIYFFELGKMWYDWLYFEGLI